jgi:hypothetical protein
MEATFDCGSPQITGALKADKPIETIFPDESELTLTVCENPLKQIAKTNQQVAKQTGLAHLNHERE